MTTRLIAAGLVLAAVFGVREAIELGAQGFALPPGERAAPPDPNVPLSFEAATIKPNKEGGSGRRINRAPGGRFSTGNSTATMLITFAYQLQGYQLIGTIPDWARNDGFDIVAKLEGDPAPVDPSAGPDHMMLAMRSLLADRFTLKFRREQREMDIYQLVMARPGGKPGPGLKPSVDECGQQGVGRAPQRPADGQPPDPPRRADGTPIFCGFQQGPGRFLFNGFALSQFANGISGRVGRQVVDRTGLTGAWSFELLFQPPAGGPPPPPGAAPAPVDTSVPDLFTAIQETLGLKLESTKGMVDVFIVESIERPTED